jgi:hypothetical protein
LDLLFVSNIYKTSTCDRLSHPRWLGQCSGLSCICPRNISRERAALGCPKIVQIILKGATARSIALLRSILHTRERINGIQLKNKKRSKTGFDIDRNNIPSQCSQYRNDYCSGVLTEYQPVSRRNPGCFLGYYSKRLLVVSCDGQEGKRFDTCHMSRHGAKSKSNMTPVQATATGWKCAFLYQRWATFRQETGGWHTDNRSGPAPLVPLSWYPRTSPGKNARWVRELIKRVDSPIVVKLWDW